MEKTMRLATRLNAAIIAATLLLMPRAGQAQDLRGEIEAIIKDYLATHPDEVGQIARDYMMKHPEAMGAILAQMLQHRSGIASSGSTATSANPSEPAKAPVDRSAAVASNADQLFSSPHQVNLGNPNGDVTLVEFFDYNCGFCKRALPDLMTLIKDDPKLKIVLKEFPILGPGSIEAARVAVAVRMEDPNGEKYLAFHEQLLGATGPASKEKALAVARDLGFDTAKLEEDMASKEAADTFNEDMKLAGALGITGTPTYVVGKDVVLGAVGLMNLQGRIDSARGHGVN
jgi:protein-disulfide isomerase